MKHYGEMDTQKDTKGERTYVAEASPSAPQKYFACGLAEDWYTGPSKPAPTASTWQNRSWSSSVSIMSDWKTGVLSPGRGKELFL
jgi:hypothetical protein